jgi:hypothetical protein
LTSTPWRNSLPAPESARASSQPKQYSFGAEPTGHLTLTPEIRVDHHPGEHGALPDPPCGAGANGESAAAETVMTRGDGSR